MLWWLGHEWSAAMTFCDTSIVPWA
jgi:hypothetical protein